MIFRDAPVGTHPTVDFGCGTLCTINYDSVISSALAVVLTVAAGFWIRSQLQSGEPGRVQAVFEWGYDQLRALIRSNVSDDALFIIPLALTLFMYILIANWIELLPLAIFPVLHGANADLNQTLAMALIVIAVVQWYSVKVLGWRGYFRRFTKPFELPLGFRIAFMPFNILEEVVKPVTLSLRLFGNIFAGGVLVHTMLGIAPFITFIFLGLELFVGVVQALIFTMLTLVFLTLAVTPHHGDHGDAHVDAHAPAGH